MDYAVSLSLSPSLIFLCAYFLTDDYLLRLSEVSIGAIRNIAPACYIL